MKVVFIANSRVEADIVRGKLEAYGIPAMTRQDDEGGLNPALALSLGVSVVVDDDDYEAATRLLKSPPIKS